MTLEVTPPVVPEEKYSRERELLPGQGVLVRVEGRNGYESNFSVVGFRDMDGRATYLPMFVDVVDSQGVPNGLGQLLGINEFIDSTITDDERQEIFKSLDKLPPLLAVDRVFNGDPNKDSLDNYTQSFDMVPPQIVGLYAPPHTGKTTFMASIAIASFGNRQSQSSVRVVDLDGHSPESLDSTVAWLVENGYENEPNLIRFHDAVKKRFEELRNNGVNRKANSGTLREKLNNLRGRYKQERKTHISDVESGLLHKVIWMADLPGVSVDELGRVNEIRKLDLADALALAMPVVKVFKAGENLQTWELPLNFEYINQQIEPTMRNFEQVLADMERTLMGRTRAERE
jgi:hypothetical protein